MGLMRYVHLALCGAVVVTESKGRCTDNNERCAEWESLGECRNNPSYMLKNCKASCGVCTCVDEHRSCKQWARNGECVANPNYMLRSCKRSCLRCKYQLEDPCSNKDVNCFNLAERGACLKSREIREKCPETCFVCGEGDYCIADPEDAGAFRELPGDAGPTIDGMFRNILVEESLQRYGPKLLSEDPWLMAFDNFLSEEEVDLVRQTATGSFVRSTAGGLVGEHSVHGGRTSDNFFCQDDCRKSAGDVLLRDKIEEITKVDRSRFEDTQMLRYKEGQRYTRHGDRIEGQNRMACGPRVLTFFVYLSDAPEAATRFPKLNVSVPALKGKAALWHNVLQDNIWMEEERTEHVGLPPAKGSMKYAANIWIHQYDFVKYLDMDCLMADRRLSFKEKRVEL